MALKQFKDTTALAFNLVSFQEYTESKDNPNIRADRSKNGMSGYILQLPQRTLELRMTDSK